MDEKQRYIDLHARLHLQTTNRDDPSGHFFPGKSIIHHVDQIAELIKETNTKTLLDYGCGQGFQYSEMHVQDKWGGLLPACYDPAVPKFADKPEGVFDGVICTDVMEHIPESALDDVFSEIFTYANKWILFSIALFKSHHNLPNGESTHVTIKPIDWWKAHLWKYEGKGLVVDTYFRHLTHFERHLTRS